MRAPLMPVSNAFRELAHEIRHAAIWWSRCPVLRIDLAAEIRPGVLPAGRMDDSVISRQL
jgi:hypothetical protein